MLPEGLPSADHPYSVFLDSIRTRRQMLYVGSNDGMLHGFNAGSYVGGDSISFDFGDGKEIFAYVPDSVIGPAMANLAKAPTPYFRHYFLVDGSPSVSDAYVGGDWKTILVGTAGAGARALFVLDITSPDSFSQSNVMWEIKDGDTAASTPISADAPNIHGDLGYTLAQPLIVRLNDGHWAAVVANGYNSSNGHAVLFIFNLEDGRLIKKIDVGGGNSVVEKNGLSSPTPIDDNGDHIVDYVYAGDLTGNLWKFDLRCPVGSSCDPSSHWGIANSSQPLFVACSSSIVPCADTARQPITSKPEIGITGTGQSGGVMVYFGSGKYFEVYDNYVSASSPPPQQAFYALWDNGNTISGRTELVAQTVTSTTSKSISGNDVSLRTTSANAVDYTSGKRGWYMDLPTSGERVAATATFLQSTGRIVFETLIPPLGCQIGGSSWIMEVNALNGNPLGTPPWDLNNDREFDGNDMTNTGQVPSGMKSSVGIVKAPAVIGGQPETKVFNGSGSGSGNPIQVITESASTLPAGSRLSWQQPRSRQE